MDYPQNQQYTGGMNQYTQYPPPRQAQPCSDYGTNQSSYPRTAPNSYGQNQEGFYVNQASATPNSYGQNHGGYLGSQASGTSSNYGQNHGVYPGNQASATPSNGQNHGGYHGSQVGTNQGGYHQGAVPPIQYPQPATDYHNNTNPPPRQQPPQRRQPPRPPYNSRYKPYRTPNTAPDRPVKLQPAPPGTTEPGPRGLPAQTPWSQLNNPQSGQSRTTIRQEFRRRNKEYGIARANEAARLKRLEEERLNDMFPDEDTDDKGEYYCLVCRHDCESDRGYRNHIRSMMHTQRVLEAQSLPPERRAKLGIVSSDDEPTANSEKVFVVNGGFSNGPNPANLGKTDMIHCEVCNCDVTGPKAYESHMAGIRHKKNLRHRDMGVPITSPRGKPSKPFPRASVVYDSLCRHPGPLIGLEYITEHQKMDPYVEPQYFCRLCAGQCDPRTLFSHLTGLKHRLNFMRNHYTNFYGLVKQQGNKKSDQTPAAEKFARMIEEEQGRQQIQIEMEVNPRSNSDSEQPGAKGEARDDAGTAAYLEPSRMEAAPTLVNPQVSSASEVFQHEDSQKISSMLRNMSDAMVSNEDEAAVALQISKALTEALLAYRTLPIPTEVGQFMEN